MLFVPLDIQSIDMSSSIGFNKGKLTDSRSVNFKVLPSRGTIIEFGSGVFFHNPRNRQIENEDDLLIGCVSVREVSDDLTLKESTMRFSSYDFDHYLFFTIHLGKTYFSDLIANIRSGVKPTQIDLQIYKKPFIDYSADPDGRDLVRKYHR